MKKVLLSLLGGIVLLVVVVLAVASTKPDVFTVERSIVIDAPAAEPFARTNDLRRFNEWNPWMKADPQSKISYAGPETGAGSSYDWESEVTGAGTMKIVDARPDEVVDVEMHFRKPFDSMSKVKFTFVPEGDATKVTWSMEGENKLVSKVMHLVMDFDKMVGGEFEKGLADLKTLSEGPK